MHNPVYPAVPLWFFRDTSPSLTPTEKGTNISVESAAPPLPNDKSLHDECLPGILKH